MVFVAQKNIPIRTVLVLGLEEFDSLHGSVTRNDAREKIDSAWTMMIAAQCQGKDMKDHTKKWEALLTSADKQALTDINALKARFGSGF